MNGNLLADRAVGCLAAAAVGDALGGPTEGWESHEIHDHFGGWVGGVVESIRRAKGVENMVPPQSLKSVSRRARMVFTTPWS